MSLNRFKLIAILARAGILISVTAAWIYNDRSDRYQFSYHTYESIKVETEQQPRFHETGSQQDLTSPPQQQSNTDNTDFVLENPLSARTAAEPAPSSSSFSANESGEKDFYFELMTTALEKDFPELNLSEIDRTGLSEVIWKIRKSFDQIRSSNRSVGNADIIYLSHLVFRQFVAFTFYRIKEVI